MPQLCEYCHTRNATHFCTGCRKWVCSNAVCLARATAAAGRRFLFGDRREQLRF
jgi:hypothetical protein